MEFNLKALYKGNDIVVERNEVYSGEIYEMYINTIDNKEFLASFGLHNNMITYITFSPTLKVDDDDKDKIKWLIKSQL